MFFPDDRCRPANFAVGANTTLAVAGKSSITAANAIFDGIIDLPASSTLTVLEGGVFMRIPD